ncbi:hypothetical protein P1P68_31470 [Streptomyces scabiei]|nr:hypothetical protein [Streptomyces scabiei]MDW8809198.1 hypothetical protein [Streptomyces scabiei]
MLGVFGANASGKSDVVAALKNMLASDAPEPPIFVAANAAARHHGPR